eukprot:365415-Chlamydomonas_euryale.AAC.7
MIPRAVGGAAPLLAVSVASPKPPPGPGCAPSGNCGRSGRPNSSSGTGGRAAAAAPTSVPRP